jgi:predicted nucleic acid-binding protein
MAETVLIDTWGWLAIGHRRDPRHQEIKEFYQHHKPKISFTDLASIVIMRDRNIKKVLTDDDHFTHVGMDLQKVP